MRIKQLHSKNIMIAGFFCVFLAVGTLCDQFKLGNCCLRPMNISNSGVLKISVLVQWCSFTVIPLQMVRY